MKAVVQRVNSCSVSVEGEITGKIGAGLLVLLGVGKTDEPKDVDYLADKIVNLRIFEDENGKLNLSLNQISGEMLIVSQFTLLADCRKGRRPSFANAALPDLAVPLYEKFISAVKQKGIPVQTGRFGAMMDVSLVNSGPVTLVIESPA